MSLFCDYFICCFVVFFFKQKTAYEMRISDWSSDVCSSDLFVMKVDTGTQGAARLLQRHNVPKVVHDPTFQDLYARDMLTLFAPWRGSPVALLAVGGVEPGSWTAAFQEFVHTGRCPEHIRRGVAVYERQAAVQDDDASDGGDHSSDSDEHLAFAEHPDAPVQRDMGVPDDWMLLARRQYAPEIGRAPV